MKQFEEWLENNDLLSYISRDDVANAAYSAGYAQAIADAAEVVDTIPYHEVILRVTMKRMLLPPSRGIYRLTAERDEMKATLHNLALDWQVITAENQRLREALEEIIDCVGVNCVDIAREALEVKP